MPVPDKPRYPIPWIATYLLTALALIAGSFVMVWYVNRATPKVFDYAQPDMAFLERIVLSADPRKADFSGLNGGDWQVLCLAGGTGDVGQALTRADIAQRAGRILHAAHAAIAGDIGETEFALVYVDNEGAARAVHHPHGFAFARAGAAKCTVRDKPVIPLPVGG